MPDMSKQRTADPPAHPSLLLPLLHDPPDLLRVNNLVEPAGDQSSGQVLELLARVEQQVVGRHGDREFLAVARPGEEARVAGFAVDCKEVEVVVETC